MHGEGLKGHALQEESPNALGEEGNVEVDQETGGGVLEAHVCEELGSVDLEKLFDGLDLDEQGVCNQEVGDIPRVWVMPL